MPTALECADLSKSFDGHVVLRQVNLTVYQGTLAALLGPSGCGKTTLLRLIAGFEQPDGGIIRINGQRAAGQGRGVPPEARRVGMVFQEYALFHHLDVAANVAFGLRGTMREKRRRVAELLELVGLSGCDRRMPHELSGGQQQRVALARALAPHPAVLLLDEPFSNLDAALRLQVRTEVRSILKAAGTTCVFVTHDQEEALSLADEVAVMLDGQIAQMASPQQVYHRPTTRAVAAFVGEANFLQGYADGAWAGCSLGHLPLTTSARGPVELLIRPESLHLTPANGSAAVAAVQWCEFYGHDQRLGITLTDGTSLIARLGPEDTFAVGERVAVRVRHPVIPFPRSSFSPKSQI